MPCTCGHQIRDHKWKLKEGELEPCLRCGCKDFKEETSERKINKHIKKGIW